MLALVRVSNMIPIASTLRLGSRSRGRRRVLVLIRFLAYSEPGPTASPTFMLMRLYSPSWQFVSQGCSYISVTIATAYDTLGEDGLRHSLNEPECVGVFTNVELLPIVAKVSADVPSLRFVIYDGEAAAAGTLDKLKGTRENFRVLHIDELRALGRAKPAEVIEGRLPSPDDVACIMYTSGTTGAPKGVVIKHSNLIAAVGAIYTLFGHELNADDTFLAFLPLAHILEYIVELCFVFVGMVQGYGRVKTLTDASVRNCVGDIKALKPSVMVAVPAVWELIRKGIMSQINAGGTITKSVFHGAMSIKKNQVPLMKNVVDNVVFNKVRQATGGRLRLALSGGAALSKETQEFLSLALVTLLQGTDLRFAEDEMLNLWYVFRLRHDRVLRHVLHPPTRVHAVQHRRLALASSRNQAARRAGGRL
jgi:long-chain acyl-CoA synthetase